MSAARKTVVTAGSPRHNGFLGPRPAGAVAGYFSLYEKTTDNSETVVGRIAKRGTNARQVKLWTTGVRAVGVFDYSIYHQGRDSNDKVDSEMAYDGQPVAVLTGGDFLYETEIITTDTIVYGDPLEPETATGKLRKYTGVGPIVALAAGDGTFNDASAHRRLRVQNLIGPTAQKIWTTETPTVTTNVATLTNTPEDILYVEATDAVTLTGNKAIIMNGTVATGEVKISGTGNKTFTFYAADGVTGAKVKYSYYV